MPGCVDVFALHPVAPYIFSTGAIALVGRFEPLWDRLESNPANCATPCLGKPTTSLRRSPEGGMPSAVHTVAHPRRFADVLVAAVTMALGRRGLLSLLPPSCWSLLLKHSTSGAVPPPHTRPRARAHTHWHIHTDKHACTQGTHHTKKGQG